MTDERFKNLSAEDADIVSRLPEKLDIANVMRLPKGCEQKFRMENSKGKRVLLRINGIEGYKYVKNDPAMYNYVYDAGISIMRCSEMDIFYDGKYSYQLYTWFEGADLSEALPPMDDKALYETGLKCGKVMRSLHALKPMHPDDAWSVRFTRKIEDAAGEEECPAEIAAFAREELAKWKTLLESRPQSFTHGDWNPENLMLVSDGSIGIIDLSGENDHADPWWEFWLIPLDFDRFAEFYAGQLIGYFDGMPPEDFFNLLPVYMALFEMKYPHDPSELVGAQEILNAVKRLKAAAARACSR